MKGRSTQGIHNCFPVAWASRPSIRPALELGRDAQATLKGKPYVDACATPAIGTTGNPRGANSDRSECSFTSWMYAHVLISHARGARNHAAMAPTDGNSNGPTSSAVMSARTPSLIERPRAAAT